MKSILLLHIFITLCLFVIYTSSDAATDACEDVQIQSCDACIQAHPKCAWCLESSQPNANIKRCRSIDKFESEGTCKDLNTSMEYYKSSVAFPKDAALSDPENKGKEITQLRPQKIHLDLRKGDTKKFRITYRKVSDYPVDLYYVMDLSNSMKDDLKTLQTLGTKLADDISNVTENVQLGFGTFVDKVMMPFASTVPAQLENPCFKNTEDERCAPPFGFKHQQKISADKDAFRDAVTSTRISGNIDSPEGGFDALMQIAVCTEKIGWRNESTHLVVFTTDASFHMALDGKLAAILEMNDMGCHLQRGANPYLKDDVVYSKSKLQDYPSIGQLRHVFNKYKIQPIFAVTKEVKPLYDGLRELIPNSHVDQLANDSSNIINIIQDAYNKLRGKLEMTWTDKPKEISMKYRVLCPDQDWVDNSLRCENITIGSEAIYEFEVTANGCPTGELPPMSFTSSSLKEAVEISFSFQCGCGCSNAPSLNDTRCENSGDLVCGVCQCDDRHEGTKCQCTRESKDVSLIDKCKRDGPSDDVCENNGVCQCGICSCNTDYSGDFCECSSKGCPKDEDRNLCGGSERGTCLSCNNDQKCYCKNGWMTDPNLQTCTCHPKLCVAANDTKECSGHGTCQCNQCDCEDNGHWRGKYCEKCVHPECKGTIPECQSDSTKFVACAICVNQAQSKGKGDCTEQCDGVQHSIVQEIPDCLACKPTEDCYTVCKRLNTTIAQSLKCKTPLPQSECDIVFEVVWYKDYNDFGILVKQYNKDTDCRAPANPILIVLPIVAGIVLIGLLLLLAWKIYQTIRDKKEWENFEKDMKQSKWTKGQNPIFQKPMTKFQNPTYQGH